MPRMFKRGTFGLMCAVLANAPGTRWTIMHRANISVGTFNHCVKRLVDRRLMISSTVRDEKKKANPRARKDARFNLQHDDSPFYKLTERGTVARDFYLVLISLTGVDR